MGGDGAIEVGVRCDAHGDDCRTASCPESAAPGSFSARRRHPCGRRQRTPTPIAPSPPIGNGPRPFPSRCQRRLVPVTRIAQWKSRLAVPSRPSHRVRSSKGLATRFLTSPSRWHAPCTASRRASNSAILPALLLRAISESTAGSSLLLFRSPLARARAAPLSRGAERRATCRQCGGNALPEGNETGFGLV